MINLTWVPQNDNGEGHPVVADQNGGRATGGPSGVRELLNDKGWGEGGACRTGAEKNVKGGKKKPVGDLGKKKGPDCVVIGEGKGGVEKKHCGGTNGQDRRGKVAQRWICL